MTLLPALETTALSARAEHGLNLRGGGENHEVALGGGTPLQPFAILDEVIGDESRIFREIFLVEKILEQSERNRSIAFIF